MSFQRTLSSSITINVKKAKIRGNLSDGLVGFITNTHFMSQRVYLYLKNTFDKL